MATDEQLIEQIQFGKSEAYGQLFRKYYQRIYSICFAILNNPHDAEEITQETFIHAYLKLAQLKNPEKFFAWLKKIARNRSKNYMRKTRTEIIPLDLASAETVYEEDALCFVRGCTPGPITPDEHILMQELLDSIIEAIESLPPKDREVVRAHIDGLSHAEISEQFGISIEASMSRLSRARKKIAAQVKDLLSAIFGLPKMLPLKKIISGGILAMKIGTSAKVTVSVIGVLVAGFIGFLAMHYSPDNKPPKPATFESGGSQPLKEAPKRALSVEKAPSKPSDFVSSEDRSTEDSLTDTFAQQPNQQAKVLMDETDTPTNAEEPDIKSAGATAVDDKDGEVLTEQPGAVVWGRGRDIQGIVQIAEPVYHDGSLCPGQVALGPFEGWVNERSKIQLSFIGRQIPLSSEELFKQPLLLISGNNPVELNEAERANLRKYLVEKGGLLVVDGAPGEPGGSSIQTILKEILPDSQTTQVNNEHEIYRNYYEMGGPPPGAEETGKRYLEGTFLNGNLIALYSERNYWLHLTKPTRGLTEEEHQQVSALIEAKKPIPDWVSMRTSDHGTKRFFTNLLIYAITRGNIADYSNYAP